MKRILKEPTLHFLLIGAVLFFAHRAMNPAERSGNEPGSKTIVVTRGRIQSLVIAFTRTWHREPTADEVNGLIDDYLREEVATREAVALGLDRDDTVVRRRLRQKLEFVSDDLASQTPPTDPQLAEYFRAHADLFRQPGTIAFAQVFLDPQARGERLQRDAADLLAQLNAPGTRASLDNLGDPMLLPRQFGAVSDRAVSAQFGDQFLADLAASPVGKWHGPIVSAFGAHLVRVESRTPPSLPELAQVRDAVRREWENARRGEAQEQLYRSLLARYQVTIEGEHAGSANPQVTHAK